MSSKEDGKNTKTYDFKFEKKAFRKPILRSKVRTEKIRLKKKNKNNNFTQPRRLSIGPDTFGGGGSGGDGDGGGYRSGRGKSF